MRCVGTRGGGEGGGEGREGRLEEDEEREEGGMDRIRGEERSATGGSKERESRREGVKAVRKEVCREQFFVPLPSLQLAPAAPSVLGSARRPSSAGPKSLPARQQLFSFCFFLSDVHPPPFSLSYDSSSPFFTFSLSLLRMMQGQVMMSA